MMNNRKEPEVQINGVALTEAQSMTLRVAISGFAWQMEEDDALGTDEHGRAMTQGYREASIKIINLMMLNQ